MASWLAGMACHRSNLAPGFFLHGLVTTSMSVYASSHRRCPTRLGWPTRVMMSTINDLNRCDSRSGAESKQCHRAAHNAMPGQHMLARPGDHCHCSRPAPPRPQADGLHAPTTSAGNATLTKRQIAAIPRRRAPAPQTVHTDLRQQQAALATERVALERLRNATTATHLPAAQTH